MFYYVILHNTVRTYVSEHTYWTCFHCDDIYGDRTCEETISCPKDTQVSLIYNNVQYNYTNIVQYALHRN